MEINTANEKNSTITAKALFDDILDNHENEKLTINEKYEAMNICFLLVLKDKTKDTTISFAGPFPRMTYLCKKYEVPTPLYTYINTFRLHARGNSSTSQEELEDAYKYDLKALVDFIAAIYHSEPTNRLKELLRFPYKKYEGKRAVAPRVRIAVENWDDQYIYGKNADFESDIIKVDYTTNNKMGDNFAYFKPLLDINTQINLINPTITDGIYYPELMIYEPDFLIDISSIASCFTEYGNNALNYLVNKIKPSEITSPILLGNFASQFLDELINNKTNQPISYNKSVMQFFRNNAIDLATCSDININFHNQAKEQQQNIKNIIETQFKDLSNIDMDKIVLEPSFFSEMLGIQGRMDLLQADYRILMEQKSGKRDFATNRHKETHYVQILLYQAIIHYGFALKNENIASFLLYSKYSNGLLEEGPAPRLLHLAMKIRNEIVNSELSYTNEDEIKKIFDRMNPDMLNTKKISGKLWDQYQGPELTKLLSAYKNATKLEKSYFCRLFAFIEKENILSKIGSPNKENDGFSSIWNATLDEKKQTGDIYNNLQIIQKESTTKDSGYDLITLQIPQSEDDFLSNFRIGDVVILYSYPADSEPNALKTMVLRGSVKDIKSETIVVKLRFPQRNEYIFQKSDKFCWAVEHDYMESSYNGLYKSLYSFLSATKDRRDLLMNRKPAGCDKSIALNEDYGDFNELVLRAKQAQDYFLLIGPPGTGKTSFGLVNILREALTEENCSVLLASFTNRAVEEICSKLVEHDIPFLRIGSELSCDPQYTEYLLYNKVADCPNVTAIKELLSQYKVVVGTTTSITAKKNIFDIKQFGLAIVDEASQILEPQLLGLICAKHAGQNAIGKFVFIGDYKQLPAVVQQSVSDSAVKEKELQKIGLNNCRNSLFERLIELQKDNKDVSYMLTKQGRMHPEVANFANMLFYEDKLEAVPIAHQKCALHYETFNSVNGIECLLATRRLCFIASEGYRTTSVKINIPEAEKIAAIILSVWHLYHSCKKPFISAQTIGVIVPYRNQISTIRKELARTGIEELLDITIDTVERYQGSERDIIIYGFTIHKYYQLDFLTSNTFYEGNNAIDRKLNVALTRAREQMILVGNPDVLNSNGLFQRLMNYTKKLGSYIDVTHKDFCSGNFKLSLQQ